MCWPSGCTLWPAICEMAKNESEPTYKRRVSITVDNEGRPQFDRINEDTRAMIASWMRDEKIASALGVKPTEQIEAEGNAIAGALAAPLLSALGQIDAIVLQRISGAPPEIVASVAHYTPQEQAIILPVFQRVMSKYGSGVLAKYGDEIALTALLLSLGAQKLAIIRAEVEARSARPPGTIIQYPAPAPAAEPESTSTEGGS